MNLNEMTDLELMEMLNEQGYEPSLENLMILKEEISLEEGNTLKKIARGLYNQGYKYVTRANTKTTIVDKPKPTVRQVAGKQLSFADRQVVNGKEVDTSTPELKKKFAKEVLFAPGYKSSLSTTWDGKELKKINSYLKGFDKKDHPESYIENKKK